MTLPAIAVVSLAVALVVTPAAMVVARRSDIMDRPGALKSQVTPVPYLGGVGVFAGLAVGVLAGRPSILVPMALALALGVADDRVGLPPLPRVVGEVVVGVAVVLTCPLHLPGAAGIALVAVTVLLINGVNLIDGLDLLAGGVTALAALGFAVLAHGWGRQTAVALAAALGGFLWFNRPPARVYLGDGGSYLLGTALAVLLASVWAPHVPVATGTAALALVALPAAEVAFAVVRRMRGRQSLVTGDRRHPYDRLVSRGWGRPAASGAYIGAEAVLAVGAVIAAHRSSLAVAVVVDVVAAAALTVLAGAVGALAPDSEVPS